ncbi:hypothetical protein M9H77_05473 [Catharanthus roseus]|uniref:Uncharacterized protein n=1 Tax=Catharanthus roseus TaxID=4058 RepID=A0ACC0CH26_CATRO|nr:hypothetical protein M9H77_05473 [Catharanthus roseus]
MGIRSCLANSIYNFPGRSTSSFPWLLPLMTNEGISPFISNSRTQFKKSIRCSNEFEFNFNAYRVEKINSINKALESAVPLKEPLKLHESMRYYLFPGGKRVRPLLCIASCELVGGVESMAMPIACAMEMLHSAVLMTDDLPCMDNDDFRGGKPSNHKVFGEFTTVLSSLSLFALAFDHISKATTKLGISSTNILRVISLCARLNGAEGVVAGQAADMESQGKSGIGIKQLEYIDLLKTSASFEACAVAGAIVGGASEEEINRLRKYSKYIGLLYQIRDDILDLKKDQIADKATYPKLIGMEKSMELVEKLLGDAKDQLVGFDLKKVAPLKSLADHVAYRKN